MKTTRIFLSAAVLGAVVTSLALTLPSLASADVTGWQTGYSYHQGLANGDGAMLMAQNDQAASQASAAPSAPNTGIDQSASDQSSVTNDGSAVSATPQAAPTAPQTYAAPSTGQAASPGFLASLSPLNWFGIALIVLALIIGLIALAARPGRTETYVYDRR